MAKRILFYSALALVSSVSALPAAPVSTGDEGWLAFEGCWRTVENSADNMLCIVRDGDGARMITYSNGSIVSESRMIADGQARPVSKEGCSGTEQAVWSNDRSRVFVTAEMRCGDHTRKVSGILAIQSPSEWVSVQSVKYGDQSVGRTQRYIEVSLNAVPEDIANQLRANQLARETARYSASAVLSFDDVKEAVSRVAAPAVADWLSEADQPFTLNGKSLIALADAGVPDNVIDVMVAVSNPEHFAVNNSRTADRSDRDWDRRYAGRRGYSCDDYYDPWWGSSYGSYGRNGCYADRGYYYSPWGYDPYGWRQGGTTVIVVRGGSDGSDDTRNARVTRNGYKKGSSSEDDSARDRGRSTTTSTASDTRSTSPSNGSSTSTSPSTTSTSSSSTGRTAKPRDNK